MKRVDLINYLRHKGCVLMREGSRHTVFANILSGRASTIPRHVEINNFLAKKICRDLGIEEIKKK